jgi:RHS repeat-associated protein
MQVVSNPYHENSLGQNLTSKKSVQKVRKGYVYSFQNQEHDDEIKGRGNSINYTYRMHDPRLGRFFAVDPLEKDYPWNSVYAFSENRVLDAVELEGLESADVHIYEYLDENGKVYSITNFIINENSMGFGDKGIATYYHKIDGTTESRYRAEQVNISENKKKNSSTPSIKHDRNVDHFQKYIDGLWNNGEYANYFSTTLNNLDRSLQGETGLYNYLGYLEKTGDLLKATNIEPLIITGDAMKYAALVGYTILDFRAVEDDRMNEKDAYSNLIIRTGVVFANQKTGNIIDKSNNSPIDKGLKKIGAKTALGGIKNELIVKPKPEKRSQ